MSGRVHNDGFPDCRTMRIGNITLHTEQLDCLEVKPTRSRVFTILLLIAEKKRIIPRGENSLRAESREIKRARPDVPLPTLCEDAGTDLTSVLEVKTLFLNWQAAIEVPS